jgi:hypothetical protein
MRLISASLFLLGGAAFAQPFSVGVKGGVPFTGAFSDVTTMGVDVVTRTFSESNQYIVGPMIELHLPLGLSVEADGLYRPLNFASENRVTPLGLFRSVTNISSWEFPIVGKFHLPFPIVKPYAELGPTFRHVGGNLTYFSNTGLTAGVGVEVKLGHLRFGPEIRYTRWGADAPPGRGVGFLAPSNVNQGEFLIGISF